MIIMNKLEYALLSINSLIGLSITIEDTRNFLGIIILVMQLILILYNVSKRIYKRIKKGEYDKIDDDIKEAIEDVKNLKEGK